MNVSDVFAPFWAAGLRDWIPTLILLLFVFLPAIGQFISKLLEAQKEAARRAARQPKAGGMPGGGGPRHDPIEQEIAEFLRRVAGEREKAKPLGAPPAGKTAQPSVPPPRGQPSPARRTSRPGPKPTRRPSPSQRPAPPAPVPAEVVPEAPVGKGVVQRVEQFLRTDELEERTTRLGAEVSRVDEQLEARLREKFDREGRKLGRLSSGLSDIVAELPGDVFGTETIYGEGFPAAGATGLAGLLATADSVREAIILYEILQPPWERWSASR